MSGVTVLSFPISRQVQDPFRLYVKDLEDIDQPVWDLNSSSVVLSQTLSDQCHHNLFNFRFLSALCQEGEEPYSIISGGGRGEDSTSRFQVRNYQSNKPCAKLLSAYSSYMDVFSRDQDVFRPRVTYNVTIYATVLLVDDEYYGHIYSWVSPNNPDYCVCIGIRSRVDSFFIREEREQNISVAALLLEGVRRFALTFSCTEIIVLRPLRVMKSILPKFAFVKVGHVSGKIIGKAPNNTYAEDCSECMIRESKESISDEVGTYIIKA
ncbi:Hypothetical protein BQ3484_290 [Cedratvirus A11]|uniref:Uncharacterized protein n=1 Tax=Cedratvirus A11 TaxID=1903266 RepID=A0A1M7XV01_9VIRU|nr:Hypothetical protein BQ3484_290 [Cedratvirus A11]SHO33358.1 Hypothetical protein BQ3484_290 [Cedratvirus A11]